MSEVSNLGNGVGLIYSTNLVGDFVISGIANTPENADYLKREALNKAGLGFKRAAVGSATITTIGETDSILSLAINSIEQFDISSPIAVTIGAEEDAATALVNAINDFRPASGVFYKAYSADNKIILQSTEEAGSSVNGDLVKLTFGIPASQTYSTENIDGGEDGGEIVSNINGNYFYINASDTAVAGSLAGSTEITRPLVMRGNTSPPYIFDFSAAATSTTITLPERVDRTTVIYLNAIASGELNTIDGTAALGDILILVNKSVTSLTVNDLSLGSGNLMLNPTTFVMADDNYNMTFIYENDDVNGNIWRELDRSLKTVGALAITNAELALLSVDTGNIVDLAVTEAKLGALAVTTAKINTDAVTTIKILDDNVTTPKIADLNVTTPKIADAAVTAIKLDTDSVTTVKIADGNVTVDKLESSIKTEVIVVPVSFEEAGVMGQIKFRIPYNCDCIGIDAAVVKLINIADDATIIAKDQALAAMTSGQIDLTGGAPTGNIFTSAPTANNSFLANDVLTLETSKSTVGGSAMVSLTLLRTT
jgi:hypothetical protein